MRIFRIFAATLLTANALLPRLAAVEPLFDEGARILFQGDSITDGKRGRNDDPNHILGHGYVFLIAAQQGAAFPERHLTFLNRGISGNEVGDLAQRWQTDTLDLKPDVLSVLIGVNDLAAKFNRNLPVSVEAYEKGYDQLLASAVAASPGIKLVLCEPFFLRGKSSAARFAEWQTTMQAMREVVARLAAKYHAPVVNFQKLFDEACQRAPIEYWIWDGVHPTYAGHQLMADEWARAYRAHYGPPAPVSSVTPDRWDAPQAANPILPGYYADPSLVAHQGKFFLYATLDPWGGRKLGCWESADFKQWTFRDLNWPTKEACTSPSSKGAMVWAPSVVKAPDGKFHMFVSVGSEVWTGVADHPLGPWRDAHGGKPLIAATWNTAYHMIDAEAFIDDDGRAYLYWGSGWNWKNGRCFAVELTPDLAGLVGEPREVTPPGGHYFEGPFMVKHGGKYFLSYSDGKTISDTYCVHYATGDSPFGPFREAANGPILATDQARNVVSPGHHAIFTHEGENYILYHRHSAPFVEGEAYRQLCVDRLDFTPDGGIGKVSPTHTGPAWVRRPASLAAKATATASSARDDLHTPAAALDNNYATRWAAAKDVHGAWLQVDLGSVQSITTQQLRFEYAWKSYPCLVESSVDGANWTTVADYRASPVTGSPVTIEARLATRYLRLVFADTISGAEIALFEWEIH